MVMYPNHVAVMAERMKMIVRGMPMTFGRVGVRHKRN